MVHRVPAGTADATASQAGLIQRPRKQNKIPAQWNRRAREAREGSPSPAVTRVLADIESPGPRDRESSTMETTGNPFDIDLGYPVPDSAEGPKRETTSMSDISVGSRSPNSRQLSLQMAREQEDLDVIDWSRRLGHSRISRPDSQDHCNSDDSLPGVGSERRKLLPTSDSQEDASCKSHPASAFAYALLRRLALHLTIWLVATVALGGFYIRAAGWESLPPPVAAALVWLASPAKGLLSLPTTLTGSTTSVNLLLVTGTTHTTTDTAPVDAREDERHAGLGSTGVASLNTSRHPRSTTTKVVTPIHSASSTITTTTATRASTVTTGEHRYHPASSSTTLSRKVYMYRAEAEDDTPLENVNLGDLRGVLWYLHNKVVYTCPRRFGITRIKRYRVSVTSPLGRFVDFKDGRCVAPECEDILRRYDYAVGCTNISYPAREGYPLPPIDPADAGHWYSLPGPVRSCHRDGGADSHRRLVPRTRRRAEEVEAEAENETQEADNETEEVDTEEAGNESESSAGDVERREPESAGGNESESSAGALRDAGNESESSAGDVERRDPESAGGNESESSAGGNESSAGALRDLSGSRSDTCRYWAEDAGEVTLDEIAGIENYTTFCRNGSLEYSFSLDRGAGNGAGFWDHKFSEADCARRVARVRAIFRRKYSDVADSLPVLACP